MKKLKNPRLMLIVSMTIFGTLGIFVRNIPVSSGELALYRAILAALLIAIYLIITKQRISFTKIKKEVPLLLLSGIAMGINWILLFEAYKYTTVSLATLSYYFAPVIVTVVCPVLFHERLTGKQILCFIMSTIGLVMITGIGDIGSGIYQKCRGNSKNIFTVSFCHCDIDPLCYAIGRNVSGRNECSWMDQSVDRWTCTHRSDILYVFFIIERTSRTESCYSKLY